MKGKAKPLARVGVFLPGAWKASKENFQALDSKTQTQTTGFAFHLLSHGF